MWLVVEDGEHLACLPELERYSILVTEPVAAAGGVERSGQHGKERRFPATVGAGDGQPGSGLELQVHWSDLRRGAGPCSRERVHVDARRNTRRGLQRLDPGGTDSRLLVQQRGQPNGTGLG